MSDRPTLRALTAYPKIHALSTRWADNDIYGHVNNVAYYGFFDTTVNTVLIRAGCLDINDGSVIGLVVETGCRYVRPISYPADLDIGLGVTKLGRSSVHYQLGVAEQGGADAAAEGRFVHVYVDRTTRRPITLPDKMRSFLQSLEIK